MSVGHWTFGVCLLLVAAAAFAAGPLDGIEGIYDGPEALAKAAGPVVVILDTEHPERIREELAKGAKEAQPGAVARGAPASPAPHDPFRLYKCRLLKAKLEKIAGVPCVLVHYSQVTRKEMGNAKIKAVFISARSKMMTKELDDELFAFIRETRIPTLAPAAGVS